MITPKKYIARELRRFVEIFEAARVRYVYDESSEVHFIEVLPGSLYRSDEYIAWEGDMDSRFVAAYPTECICFTSDDALVGIENAEYTICGAGYASGESKAQRPYTARRKAKTQEMEYA
jgi:hypothetical protein